MNEEERIPLNLQLRNHAELDDITSSDYTRALERLEEFTKLNAIEIQSLEELLHKAVLVEHSLRVALLTKGHEKTVVGFGKIHTGQVIDTTLDNGDALYVAETRLNVSIIRSSQTRKGNEKKIYSVDAPSANILGIFENRHGHTLSTSAHDFKHKENYWPLSESAGSSVWQGYITILQGAVKDVLSILPGPTQVPSVFTNV